MERKRWMVSDDYGRDIFYFALIDNYENPRIYLSSLNDLDQYPQLAVLLTMIRTPTLKGRQLERLAKELFNAIKKIKSLQQYYFPEYFLNKEGKFFEPAYRVIKRLQEEKLKEQEFVEAYVPYTKEINTISFEKIIVSILDSFNQKPRLIKFARIEPLVFQNNLKYHNLIDTYLDNFCFHARYYCYQDNNYTCLVMFAEKKIVMVFFTRIRE